VPHFYPVVIPAGRSVAGDSLGFHAYSLRIDNLTNQWLLEETSLAWIPPYSLGVCLRLYGTGVAIILNQAPTGQAQPTALAGEAAVGVFSDQLRTEVAGTAVRQFTLVQAVSDLTEGAQPAFPPAGTCRLWADNTGTVHHEHSDGTDYVVLDAHNFTSYVTPPYVLNIVNTQALGGVLAGTLPSPSHANIPHVFPSTVQATAGLISDTYLAANPTQYAMLRSSGDSMTGLYCGPGGQIIFVNHTNTTRIGSISDAGNLAVSGGINAGTNGIVTTGNIQGAIGTFTSNVQAIGSIYYFQDSVHYITNPGAQFQFTGGGIQVVSSLSVPGLTILQSGLGTVGIGVVQLAWYDDTGNASYVAYDATATTFFKATSGWRWMLVPTGSARFTSAGTQMMALDTAGNLSIAARLIAGGPLTLSGLANVGAVGPAGAASPMPTPATYMPITANGGNYKIALFNV
jgi:hypothetical protein